jgi:hypothetical protein
MMSAKLDPILTEYVFNPNVYANVTQKAIPHPVFGLSEYVFNPNVYANVKETVIDIGESSPDPISTPYLEVSQLSPTQGAVDVLVTTAAIIPCGDRVPEQDEIGIDLLTPGSTLVPPRGLAPLKTVIWVQYADGTPEKIYENGAPVGAWVVSSASNKYSGYERDITVGFTYTVAAPGAWPYSTLITFTVYLEDYGGKYNTSTYSFTTKAAPTAIIDAPTKRYIAPYGPVIDLSLINVALSSRARYYIARGAHDGTLLTPSRFVLGLGWENPRWGELPYPSSGSTEVAHFLFEGSVYDGSLGIEAANSKTLVLRCECPILMDGAPTEIMVYAEIHNSPVATENYREIPFACATFPSWFYVSDQNFVTRLVLPVG